MGVAVFKPHFRGKQAIAGQTAANVLKRFFLALLAVLLVTASATAQWPDAQPPGGEILKITASGSSEKIRPGQRLAFVVKIELAPNWHINSHRPRQSFLVPSRLELPAEGFFVLENVSYPPGVNLDLGFSDAPASVYEGSFSITGQIRAAGETRPGRYEIPLAFTYQACRPGACLAPKTDEFTLAVDVTGAPSPLAEAAGDDSFPAADPVTGGAAAGVQSRIFQQMQSAGWLVSLFLVFLGGLALNLTPCVYPLIPITISYFGAQSEGRTGRLFFLGLLYVLGMSFTYSVIGVVSAFSGAFFGSLLQQPAVIIGIALVFVLLSLGMFGWYDFKLPDAWVTRTAGARAGALGALFMGLTMGIVAAPCIGPFILGLAAYVTAVGNPLHGFLLFFFLAFGLGIPYLFLALFSGKIKHLPRSGKWMESIKRIFGLILLAMAVYFAAPLLAPPLQPYALPIFGLFSAFYLLFREKTANDVYGFLLFKRILGLLVVALSIYGIVSVKGPATGWPPFTPAAYQEALDNNRKMLIVFHADWCIPCRELKATTLSDPEVTRRLEDFRVFQVDLTGAEDPATRRARRRFNVQGVPTLILINSRGDQSRKITGFVGAREFIGILSGVK